MAINIFINGPIGFPPGEVAGEEGTLLSDVRRQYEARKSEDSAEEVRVFINSPGGDVDEGFAIYDFLDTLPNPVTTIGEGRVFSIASVIFLAGEKRLMAKNASLLIHNPVTGMYGEAADMEKAADYLRLTGEKIANLYAQRTGQPIADLTDMMNAETILSAPDALTLGFASGLYEPEMKAVAWSSKAITNQNPIPMSTQETKDERKTILDELKALIRGAKNEAPAEPEVVEAAPNPDPEPAAANPLQAENDELKAKIAQLEEEKEKATKELEAVNQKISAQDETLKAVNAKLEELENMPFAKATKTPQAPASGNKKGNRVQLPADFLAMEAAWEKLKTR